MTDVRSAVGASGLFSDHAVTGVRSLSYAFGVGYIPETWPSRSRIVLCCRTKQRNSTSNAVVCPLRLTVPIFSRERSFSPPSTDKSLFFCEVGNVATQNFVGRRTHKKMPIFFALLRNRHCFRNHDYVCEKPESMKVASQMEFRGTRIL